MKFLILLFLCNTLEASSLSDSLARKRTHKYSIEVGINNCYFLSTKLKNDYLKNYYLDHHNPWRTYLGISSLTIGYQKNINLKFFFEGSMYLGGSAYKENKNKYMNTYFDLVSIGIQKKLIRKGNFNYFIQPSLNFRRGVEWTFANTIMTEGDEVGSSFNGIGLGIGNGVSYNYHRFIINADIGYYYFKDKLYDPSYKVVNNLMIANLKIGFLL